MAEGKRPILSLTGLVKPEEDHPFDLATYDLLLPCRRFTVDHKVAVLGRVSLTAEFLLRLLKSADGLNEANAGAFFGFDQRDLSFVLREVEELGYIERRDGRLWLTLAGMALFQPGSDMPQIYEVEARRETVGFDLVSLGPEEFRGLDEFERWLPELGLLDPNIASAAASRVPAAFRRFYPEISSRRQRVPGDKRSLYSIDAVLPGERFSSVVRVIVRATGLRPKTGEAELPDWRDGADPEDRSAVIEAASAFLDGLNVEPRSDNAEAYDVLAGLAPEFLKDFLRRDGLAVERYYREAFTRTGEVRADRQTVPLLGSLFTRGNLVRVLEAMDYALRSPSSSELILWLTPTVQAWGATRALPELLRELKSRLRRVADVAGARRVTAIGLVTGSPEDYLTKAFDELGVSQSVQAHRALEILLVPNLMVAVTVHAPIGGGRGLPVPLGVLSFDPRVVARAQAFLAQRSGAFVRGDPLRAVVEQALEPGDDLASTTPMDPPRS